MGGKGRKGMKILIVQTVKEQEEVLAELREKLQLRYPDAAVELWDSIKAPVTYAQLREAEPDLFINFDLTGFEQSTLTGGIAYNLLNCKQIHILLQDRLTNEKYLKKQLSISMFFYCVSHTCFEYLSRTYPDIPYLKEMTGDGGINSLYVAVMEVMEICHIHD